MSTVRIFKESCSVCKEEIIFEGSFNKAKKFFMQYIKRKGFSKKHITNYEDGSMKVGCIINKNLIKLDI